MPANTRFSWINRVDADGVLFASTPSSTTNPASNVADPRVGKRLRASAATSLVIDIDFGAPVSMQALVLLGNAHEWATVSYAGSTVGAGGADVFSLGLGSPSLSPGAAEGYGLTRSYLEAEASAEYLRITITRAVAGTIDVGRIWAGPYYEVANPATLGDKQRYGDSSTKTRGRKTNAAFTDPGARYPVLDFQLPVMSTADRDELRDMNRLVGLGYQWFCDPLPDSADWPRRAILGDLDEIPAITQANFELYETAYSITSAIAFHPRNFEMV